MSKYDVAVDQLTQDDTSRVRSSVFGAAEANPDQAARAKQLGVKQGVPQAVAERNLPEAERRALVDDIDTLTRDDPALRRFYGDPYNAKVGKDEAPALSQLTKAVRGFLDGGAAKPVKDTGPMVLRSSEFAARVKQVKESNPALDWDTARSLAMQGVTIDNQSDLLQAPVRPSATAANIFSGLRSSLPIGAEQTRQGIRRQLGDLFGFEEVSADAARKGASASFRAEMSRPVFESATAEGAYSGAQSLIQNLPGLALSVMTGSPVPGLAAIGVTTESQAYNKYRDRGASGGMALLGAVGEGVTEVATEVMPMGYIVKNLGRKGAGQFLAGLLGREVPTEQVATLVQDAIDTAVANPNKTWADYFAERPDAAYKTLVATVTQAGIMSTIGAGINKAAMRAEEEDASIYAATSGAEQIKELIGLAQGLKLRERDPQTLAQLVKEVANEAGHDGNVYVDGARLAEVVEAAGLTLEQFAEISSTAAGELIDAVQAGHTVTLPLEDLVANTKDTKLEQALLPHLRMTEDGLSQEEATQVQQVAEQELQQRAQEIIQQASDTAAAQASHDAVKQIILDQLNTAGRFSKTVNELKATVAAASFTALGQRVGLSPEEMYQRYMLNVQSTLPDTETVGQVTAISPVAESQPPTEVGSSGVLRAADVLTSNKSFLGASANIRAGRPSQTKAPLDVWRTEDGRYLLVDGQHRFAESVAKGVRSFEVNLVGEGYSDYYATPVRGEEFDVTAFEQEPTQREQRRMRQAVDLSILQGNNDGQTTSTRDGAGRYSSRELAPLPGAPSVAGASGPDSRLVAVAEQYAANNGIALKRQAEYVAVDPGRASRIAAAYEAMPHAPQDPAVQEAYQNLIAQTVAQYRALEAAGYRFYLFDESNDPYTGNPWNAMRDLRANQTMGVFATEAGFGSGASDLDVANNPLLADTGIQWPYGSPDGQPKRVLANDLFRAVHDAFGHGLEGAGFRAEGEENAWQAHVRLFTGSAVGAITSETRGQNSWLNYGPYGESNRNAKVEDTVFADQKTGLMPEWVWSEGRVADETELDDNTLAQRAADPRKALPKKVKTTTAVDIRQGAALRGEYAMSIGDIAAYFDRITGLRDFNDSKEQKKALSAMLTELRFQLQQEKSGLDWYDADTQAAFRETLKHIPELANETKRQLFSIIVGLQSPGTNPRDNWVVAAEAFEHYAKTGVVPARNPATGGLWQGGVTSATKEKTLTFLNNMVQELGEAGAVEWLMTPHSVRELNNARRLWGGMTGAVAGKADDELLGLFVFGPKLAPFIMNINGVHELTIDVWASRSFGRYFGQMLGANGTIIEAPTEPQRRVMKGLLNEAAKQLDIKPYQAQALLWFFEQQLANHLGSGSASWRFSDGAKRYSERRSHGMLFQAGNSAQQAPGTVSVTGTHFSSGARTSLDGRYYGTGLKGAEKDRVFNSTDKRLRERTYFYVDEGTGVRPEAGVGGVAHEAQLTNLYDINTDPLKLIVGGDINATESNVLNAGFDGYYRRNAFNQQGAAVVIGQASRGIAVTQIADPTRPAPAQEQKTVTRLPVAANVAGAVDIDAIKKVAPSAVFERSFIEVRPSRLTVNSDELDAARELLTSMGVQVPGGTLNQSSTFGGRDASNIAAARAEGWQIIDDQLPSEAAAERIIKMRKNGNSVVKPSQMFAATELRVVPSDNPGFFAIEARPAGGTLNQENTTRGTFSVDTLTISLLEKADLSTFFHELGHFYLEVLTDISLRPDAPAEVVNDMNTLLAWFGVQDRATWASMTLNQKRKYHEKFAESFEQYLFEGKAPSRELQGVFSRVAAWMKSVYQSIQSFLARHNTQLTDEVRAVFDRLLATDEQIKEMQELRGMMPAFDSAQQAGMTPEEWGKYLDGDAEATEKAMSALRSRSLRDVRWVVNARSRELSKISKGVAEKRKAVEAEVRSEVEQEPVYAVQRWIKTGVLPDGTETVGAKLSGKALKEMYGDDPASPRRYLPTNLIDAEGGLPPDTVAEMFGFQSGDQMVRAIVAAFPVDSEVQGRTDQRMLERYGDLATPEGKARAAEEAIHNEARARFIATELAAISKAQGPVRVMQRAAKMFAEQLVAKRKIKDLKPKQHLAAETRAAKRAEQAMKAGKTQDAITAKRDHLLNFYAAQETTDALVEVERGLRYLDRVQGSETIDPAEREQIAAMLERFDLRKSVTGKELERRQTLAEWVEVQREMGVEPNIPPELLDEITRKHYREMPLADFRGLIDTIKQIEHYGRVKHKLLTAANEAEFAVARQEIIDSIVANAGDREADVRTSNTALGGTLEALKRFRASHLKAGMLARTMDGGEDGGKLWEYLIRTANKAGDSEVEMRAKATRELAALVNPLLKTGSMGGKGVFIPEINRSLNRQARIAVALNTGNESNMQRVMGGEGWTADQVEAITSTLTEQEWQFVQSVWDYFESYRPLIAAKEKRVNGVEPKWLDPAPRSVQTADGKTVKLRGGYYPVKYDPRASERAEAFGEADVARQQMRAAYTSATTRRSFTKDRVDEVTGRPLLYSFDGIYNGINEVIHDLSWHEFLIDANRLIRDPGIAAAMRQKWGPEAHQQFKTWLRDVAQGEQGAANAGEAALGWIRQGVSISGLGFNVMTALIQPLGLTQSWVRIGPKYIARGISQFIGTKDATGDVHEKSSFMRNRAQTRLRELAEVSARVKGRSKAREAIDTSAYWLMMRAQQVVDVPTWLGAYDKAIGEGNNEERAVALADQAVIDSQGSGMRKDMAAIERGGEALKLFTVFYQFFNTAYNLGATQTATQESKAKLAADYLMLFVVPVVLGALLKDALTPGDSGADDEEKLAKKLIGEEIAYMMNLMVGVREVAGAAQVLTGTNQYGTDYSGPAGLRPLGDLYKLAKQTNQGEADAALRKAIINTSGQLLRLPAAQINRSITGAEALADGKTDNPAAVIFGYQEPK